MLAMAPGGSGITRPFRACARSAQLRSMRACARSVPWTSWYISVTGVRTTHPFGRVPCDAPFDCEGRQSVLMTVDEPRVIHLHLERGNGGAWNP